MQSLIYAFHHTLTEIRREGTGGWVGGGDNNIRYDIHHVTLSSPSYHHAIIMQSLTYARTYPCTFVCGNGGTGTQVSMLHCWLWQAKLCQRNATSKTVQTKEQNCDILGGRNPHETQFSIKGQSKTQVFWDYKTQNSLEKTMYFQLPTVNTWKNHDVHRKKVHETTAPCIFVKTTKHKIAMPARTVSGPAGCLCLLNGSYGSYYILFLQELFVEHFLHAKFSDIFFFLI